MLKSAIPLGSLLRLLLITISKESIRTKTRASTPMIRNLLTKVIGAVHGFLSSEKPDVQFLLFLSVLRGMFVAISCGTRLRNFNGIRTCTNSP